MGDAKRERARNINRLVWMVIFLAVAGYFGWMEVGEQQLPLFGWFLAAGVWSALCGIGYSVTDWLIPEDPQPGTDGEDSSEPASVTQDSDHP